MYNPFHQCTFPVTVSPIFLPCSPLTPPLPASIPALYSLLAVFGGRSRLHLIDLGSLEGVPDGPGGPLCLSLSALGSVILALVSGAKHVPYR